MADGTSSLLPEEVDPSDIEVIESDSLSPEEVNPADIELVDEEEEEIPSLAESPVTPSQKEIPPEKAAKMLTDSVLNTSLATPDMTQEERVVQITNLDQIISKMSADPSDPKALYREALVAQKETLLEQYKKQSDKDLRVRGYEALMKDLPQWMRTSGTEFGKDMGVSYAAMKGGSAGAGVGLSLSSLAGPYQPFAALVTVPSGFLMGAVATGGAAEVLLDTPQDFIAGKDEDDPTGEAPWREKAYKQLARGGLNGLFTGALDGVQKATHFLRTVDANTKKEMANAVLQTITGSTGRSSALVQKVGERKAQEFATTLIDDGYMAALSAWNRTKTVPRQWKKMLEKVKGGVDDETYSYLDDLIKRADSSEASMRDVHDAIQGLHGVQMQFRLSDPSLSQIKIRIDWDEVASAVKKKAGLGQEETIERGIKGLKKVYDKGLSVQDANALKIRGAGNSKYFSTANESIKSGLNKHTARVINEAMEREVGAVNPQLLSEIQYHNKVNAVYHEMAGSVRRTSASQWVNSAIQQQANAIKSPDAFAQSLLGGGVVGRGLGGVAGAAGGFAYGMSEGYDPISADMLASVGIGMGVGSAAGSGVGGSGGSVWGAMRQSLSYNLTKARHLSKIRALTGAGARVGSATGLAKLVKSIDVLAQDPDQYALFITTLSAMFGQEAADAYADMSQDEKREMVAAVARGNPSLFEDTGGTGLYSLVDDVIVDPEERVMATRKMREEMKLGVVDPLTYAEMSNSIHLSGKIVTPEPLRRAAEDVPEETEEEEKVEVFEGVTRNSTSEQDSAIGDDG